MSASVHILEGLGRDFSPVRRTKETMAPEDLSNFASRIRAMINSGLIDAADVVAEASTTAKSQAPKVAKALNRVIDFSIGEEASDAFHAARERHREIARRRTAEFMKTTYVSHFPGQTLGERKKDLVADFRAAISDHKMARDQLHKMAIDRQLVSVARHEHLHELREKKATVAERIYDAGIASGRIAPDDSVYLTKQDKIRYAFQADAELAKQARLERDKIRQEIKQTKKEAKADLSARDKAYAKLASGNGSTARMFKRLFKTGVETVKAAFTSAKDLDAKFVYTVKRGAGRIVLENAKLADATHGMIEGVLAGTKAAVVEAASATAHKVVNTARRKTRPAMAT